MLLITLKFVIRLIFLLYVYALQNILMIFWGSLNFKYNQYYLYNLKYGMDNYEDGIYYMFMCYKYTDVILRPFRF